jgi:hypothetical protein
LTLISNVQNYLKDVWSDGYEDEAIRIHTLLDRVSKKDILGDLNYYYLVKYANSQNIALGDDTISAAQAVGSSSSAIRFAMQPSIMSGEAILPVTQLEASLRGNEFAFGSLIETEVDGMMDEFYARRAFQLYRDSYGDRGQVSTVVGNVITLLNPFDAVNFMQQMPLNASVNVTGGSPRSGTITVTAVDVSGGTITVDNAGLISGLTLNDYLFASTEIGQFGMEGLGLLTPATAPVKGSDSFRGQDRGNDPSRLAGSRLTTAQANGTIEQNMVKLLSFIRIVGGRSDFTALNSERAMEVRVRLGAKVRYEPGGDATYGFSTFMLDTPQGPVKVLDDPDCPSTGFWVGRESSHEIATLDSFVRFDETDGNWAYKKPSNNQIGVRIRSVCNYLQRQPRDFGYGPIA